MWRLAYCAAFAGCGFQSNAAAPDSGGIGSVTDASVGDGSPAADARGGVPVDLPPCIQHWIDSGTPGPNGAPGPSLPISSPQLLSGFAIAGTNDRDPWISADGMQLYFSRNTGTHGYDIYFATRQSTGDDFTNITAIDNVNTSADENRPVLSADGTTMFYASSQSGNNKFEIFVTTGSPPASYPSPTPAMQMVVTRVNTGFPNTTYYDPFLSSDGLRLYLAVIAGSSPQQIAMASRTATDQQFSMSSQALFENVYSSSGAADPGLSADERVIVFSSSRTDPFGHSGGTNLWFAVRQNATDPFGPAQILTAANSDVVGDDGDPVLSADGCELYFSSNRQSVPATYHLYKAVVQK